MKKISRIEYCAGFEPLQSGMEQDEGSRILLSTETGGMSTKAANTNGLLRFRRMQVGVYQQIHHG